MGVQGRGHARGSVNSVVGRRILSSICRGAILLFLFSTDDLADPALKYRGGDVRELMSGNRKKRSTFQISLVASPWAKDYVGIQGQSL
jgi:hypothetical protein